MNDIVEYIANIRYLMNEAIAQVDNVHQLTSSSELDLETVLLNVNDVMTQMGIVQKELGDLSTTLNDYLKEEEDVRRGIDNTDTTENSI
jgi:hypothetical protein